MLNEKSKIMKIKFYSISLFALAVMFLGCSNGDDASSETGKMTVQLVDAPFPNHLVAEANVIIFKIDARNKEKDAAMEGNPNADVSPFIVLMEREVRVNLLDLTNGVTENLVDMEVPVGTYDLVRVYVKGVNVVLTDGTTYDLKVPSGEQTGIKVFIKPGLTVAGGLSADLLLDFDVSRSFVAKGYGNDLSGIKGFNFKPVIKASNLSTAGSLAGLVTTLQVDTPLGLEGAQVSVFAADTLNTTTFTDKDGKYMVMGLLAGSYDVAVDAEGYDSQSVEGVGIVAANTTTQNFELVATE